MISQDMKEAKEKTELTSVITNVDGQEVSKIHVMRPLPASMKVKQCLKYFNSEYILMTFLHWMGLLHESENRVLFGVFSGLFILTTISSLIMICIHRNSDRLKLSLLHLSTYFLGTLIWLSMRRQRKRLPNLLRSVSKSQSFFFTKFQKVFFYLTCSVPFLCVTQEVLKQTIAKTTDFYYIYGFQVSFYVGNLVNSLAWILHSFIYPTYANLVGLLYSLLCLYVCTKLSLITDDIESCSAQEFTISRQRDVLGREAEIERLVHCIQKIFSVPSFLIATAHFSACIAILGTLIVNSRIYTKDYAVLNQLIVVFLSSSGGLLACLWAAGGIPIEEDRFKDTFRRKTKQRFQLVNGKNERCIQNQILEKPTFVLSGCEIIYFRRSSILSLAGTVLTYTILLIRKN
ncbi:hypothetical protein AVEN_85273-1 [Araneus ventricosus]|uniref:Gustatory receptor n=1 Tax=Araneus ventricosus TaxID=182803 RepID=A0A4Y2K0P2_ARAVE|nr:hypothetical protein AVEN_85273-1 [Araneus ventricosus]